uniref:Uncharacterized protein n=1 Tax=Salmo trutta TaxID=8032 RepID=A0A674ALC4_SALTR
MRMEEVCLGSNLEIHCRPAIKLNLRIPNLPNVTIVLYFLNYFHSKQDCLAKTPSTAERKEFTLDFTRTLIKADIPLEKGPKFSTFLKKHCREVMSTYVPSLQPGIRLSRSGSSVWTSTLNM